MLQQERFAASSILQGLAGLTIALGGDLTPYGDGVKRLIGWHLSTFR
jgi:hypothetical protein